MASFENIIESNAESKAKSLSGVTLTNGEFISAQMAVIATGITPNKELAETANIDFNRAIFSQRLYANQ